jgi:hypothetical protein
MRFLTSEQRDALPGPERVNIIFQGLMAFRVLDSRYYEVLIPASNGPGDNCHQAKFGNPLIEYPLHNFVDPPNGDHPFPARRITLSQESARNRRAASHYPARQMR